jgi:O-acetyl-ADP-ribose deacetylase (regulator of RNase III)
MIEYIKDNILSTDCRVIIHGCNAQGKMNSGVAKTIRNRFPQAYKEYISKYEESGLSPGEIILAEEDGYLIVNAITQEFYGYDGKQYISYRALSECLKRLANHLPRSEYSDEPIAMPRIGCGLGGGDWTEIEPLIALYLRDFRVKVYDY